MSRIYSIHFGSTGFPGRVPGSRNYSKLKDSKIAAYAISAVLNKTVCIMKNNKPYHTCDWRSEYTDLGRCKITL